MIGEFERATTTVVNAYLGPIMERYLRSLEGSLGESDEPDREVEAGEPGGSFDEVREVFEVDFDIGARANASHGGDESDGGVGLYHTLLLCHVKDLNSDRSRIV